MKLLRIEEILSYQQSGQVEERSLLDTIYEYIKGKAQVYVAMDHAVALGLYENGMIQIGLGLERKVEELPLAYVQELRVFDAQKELRALRFDDVFRWRLRVDQGTEPGSCTWSVLDEKHKLWGSVQKEKDMGTWSLLSEKRGSAIFFPDKVGLHGEKALLVRNYIEFKKAEEENGLVHFADERLCGFVDWQDKEREGEQHDGEE